MTRDETARLVAAVNMLWPHSNLGPNPDAVVSMWHTFLEAYEYREIDAALRELAATGREHAPPVGLVVRTAADRGEVAPDWDEVREEVLRAIQRYRPPVGVGDPYAAPPPEFWSHPLVARFMDGAWNEWRMAAEADGTFNAQQREAWKALAVRSHRSTSLAAVGAPRKAREGLRRPDYLEGLPAPETGA